MDWNEIKAEYVRTNISQRKLAQKYGVSPSLIAKRSTREGWINLRKQRDKKVEAKIIDVAASEEVTRINRILKVSDKLLDAIERYVENAPDELLGRDLKSLTGAIKDLRDIQQLKGDEQAVVVRFEGDLNKYAQ